MTELSALPDDLPVPGNNGAADHLTGASLPALALVATTGERVRLDQLGRGRGVLYFSPMTGRPGRDLPAGWSDIPGARGCTAEACDFRDHHADLLGAGGDRARGLRPGHRLAARGGRPAALAVPSPGRSRPHRRGGA